MSHDKKHTTGGGGAHRNPPSTGESNGSPNCHSSDLEQFKQELDREKKNRYFCIKLKGYFLVSILFFFLELKCNANMQTLNAKWKNLLLQ